MANDTRLCSICPTQGTRCIGKQRVAECEVVTQRCSRCKLVLSVDRFSPSYRGNSGTWCRSCFAAYNNGDRSPSAQHEYLMCWWCCGLYIPRHLKMNAEYCSRECKSDAKGARIAANTLATKAKLVRECLHCAKALPASARSDAVFCSARCNGSAHALQRKLRVRTESGNKPGYLRAAICARDKWKCGICGKPVDQELSHPDLMAPSLDHIVPVSRGGGNEVDNLHLTHLVCNLRRRNLPLDMVINK
jgi:5-methylcytosine-specific restriction endonuclease McrA